ncbi:hypothetical protein B0H19DRAFT_1116116 [Mycena capillaripes]|nr:hypothetical protein B0H19DRAFT_1116116 [Mycena capillaripes]
MGRALFSETYGVKAPAIRVAQEPICPDYRKWSLSNPFDPDSDEFFQGAEFEAFMDQGEVDRMEHPVVVSDSSSSSSSSSDSSDSGHGSPILGADMPQTIRVNANAIWDRLVDESAADSYRAVVDEVSGEVGIVRIGPLDASVGDSDVVTIRATADPAGPRSVTVSVASPIHPPSSLRNSTTATDLERASSSSPSPRRVSVPPINIPFEPSTPGPVSPASSSPSTPPTVYTHLPMVTPSPPPTVTPRIYVWGSRAHAPTSPASPSVRHTYSHSLGPLTNPGARQSLTRITPRRRAQNV